MSLRRCEAVVKVVAGRLHRGPLHWVETVKIAPLTVEVLSPPELPVHKTGGRLAISDLVAKFRELGVQL